jgi:MFS family permease
MRGLAMLEGNSKSSIHMFQGTASWRGANPGGEVNVAEQAGPNGRHRPHELAVLDPLRGEVRLLMGCGVVAAAQIGKAIIAVTTMRSELGFGLGAAGLIVATFATLGAASGIGASVIVGRMGIRRSLIGGMWTIAAGNAIGAVAPNEFVLLAGRIVEGIGFLGVVLAIPSMLARLVTGHAPDSVMAAWSAYMPAGIMLMLLAAPLLPILGWRSFWWANAAATACCATLLAAYASLSQRCSLRHRAGFSQK